MVDTGSSIAMTNDKYRFAKKMIDDNVIFFLQNRSTSRPNVMA